jgi:sulfotransferase family protein
METAHPRPIFIVGSQRSGTTLLRLMLDSHRNISCGPETRFLTDLAKLTDESWSRLSLFGFPKEYWHAKVADFFESFQTDYARRRGKSRWADKTPIYTPILGFVTELFPTSQIIHVIRDGRDVIVSHRERWGLGAAWKSTRKWPRYIRIAREVGATLPADRYLEVRYERLVGDPEATMRELLSFLGEPWDPAVLEHDTVPHDEAPRYADFTRSRRAAADDPGAVYRTRIGSHRRELNVVLRVLLWLRARDTMRELGYGSRPARPQTAEEPVEHEAVLGAEAE